MGGRFGRPHRGIGWGWTVLWRRSRSTGATSPAYVVRRGRTYASPRGTSCGTHHRLCAVHPGEQRSVPHHHRGDAWAACVVPAARRQLSITQLGGRRGSGPESAGATQLTAAAAGRGTSSNSTGASPPRHSWRRPSVDAGLLVIRRRPTPLLTGDRVAYQRWVARVFAGRGRGLPDILARSAGIRPAAARRWCEGQLLGHRNLPRDLTAEQWAEAYRMAGSPQQEPKDALRPPAQTRGAFRV